MSDPTVAAPAPVDAQALIDERAQELYDQLLPYAEREWRAYFINRAPKDLADAMVKLVDAKVPEADLPPLPSGPPSDPPTENALGQYAAQRAAAKAAEAHKDEVATEIAAKGPGAEQPPAAVPPPVQPPVQPAPQPV